MTYIKLVNGEPVEMTPEEISARQAEESEALKPKERDLSAIRDHHLYGGITLNGIFIATGDIDRGLINGAVTRALLDNNDAKTYPYYPAGGGSVPLSNAQFKAIGQAVANHVQKCLDAAEALNPDDYTTIEDLEAAYVAALA